jgi:hypothetical protein
MESRVLSCVGKLAPFVTKQKQLDANQLISVMSSIKNLSMYINSKVLRRYGPRNRLTWIVERL